MIVLLPNGLGDFNLERAIQRHVQFTLDYTDGNYKWAADEMGINPSTIHRWREAWARAGVQLRPPSRPDRGGRRPRKELACSA